MTLERKDHLKRNRFVHCNFEKNTIKKKKKSVSEPSELCPFSDKAAEKSLMKVSVSWSMCKRRGRTDTFKQHSSAGSWTLGRTCRALMRTILACAWRGRASLQYWYRNLLMCEWARRSRISISPTVSTCREACVVVSGYTSCWNRTYKNHPFGFVFFQTKNKNK